MTRRGPRGRGHARIGRALAALTAGALVAACASARPPAPTSGGDAAGTVTARPKSLASRDVDLADWGLRGVGDLRYARVGVLHQDPPALVVYHLGATDPAAHQRPTPARRRLDLRGGGFLVGRLDAGNENRLGGYFNGFAKAPARATVAVEAIAPGERALAFDYDRPPDTFAGFWIHLFETPRPPSERAYLDAREAGWLTFEVRGARGGEPIRLQLADRDWERRQDSVPLGPLGDFLPDGRVTGGWQRAWVPLATLPEHLDRSRLASVVFLVDPTLTAPQTGRLFVRDLAFTVARALPPQLARPDRRAPAPAPRPTRHALWLWETTRLLATPGALDDLATFVADRGFTDLFVQLPFVDHAPGERHWSARWDTAGMRRLIARLSRLGVRVHALDGAAWYARRGWHDRVARTLDQIVAYNADSPPEARFHGVRYDIEPYLLPEFAGHRREQVLADYVALLARLAATARAARLELGVDIPFWFDARDEVTGELSAPVGGRPASEVIIDLADNVGLMDYRTTAYGADGVLAHAEGELAYADAAGKSVLIGLETVPLPDETIFTYDAGRRTRWDMAGDLVVEPLGGSGARLTFIPRSQRRADGHYPWTAPGAVLLRQRDALAVPAAKITFATLRPEDLQRTMSQARPELERHRSFSGFIIHSYESYRPWLAQFPPDRRPADATADAHPIVEID